MATYPYVDERWQELFWVQRCAVKHFRQFRFPDPDRDPERISWRLGKTRRVLYNLPRVISAVNEGEAVYIVEGEKDADAVERAGAFVGTCNPGGADKWRDDYAKHLKGASVIVIPDSDGGKGDRHAADVVKSLTGVAADIRVARPRAGKDVSDHLDAGYGLGQLNFVSPTDLLPSTPAADAERGVRSKPTVSGGTDNAAKLLGRALTKVSAGEGRNAAGFWFAAQLRDHGFDRAAAHKWMNVYVDVAPDTNTAGQVEPYTAEDAKASLNQAYQEDAREGFLNKRGVELVRLSSVERRPVEWLWQGRIPYGHLTILEGDPENGKSSITLDIAARVSTGRPLHGDTGERPVGGVVMLSGEDSPEDTILPRLLAADGDPDRVAMLKGRRDDEGRLITVQLPDDQARIEQAVEEMDARLLVIDPITAYLGERTNTNNDASVRRVLSPLAEFANNSGVAVVLIRHLNKDGSKEAMYRGGGSIGFSGAARSVLAVGKHPDRPDVRGLARVKNNLHVGAVPLVYSVVTAPLYDAPKIVWEGEDTSIDANVLVGGRDGRRDAPARDEAMDLLREALGDGPRPAREVQDELELAGVSTNTIKRAKKELGVIPERQRDADGKTIGWTWRLPNV